MDSQNRLLWAQLIGLVAIVAARFGIDISAEQQADLLAGLSAFGLVFTAVLAAVQAQRGPVSPPSGKESGKADAGLLLAVAMALVVALAACTLPQTPRQAIAESYVAVETVAELAEIAYRDGDIDAPLRADIRQQLQRALDGLVESETILNQGGAVEDRLRSVRAILAVVQATIPAEAKETKRDE